MPNPNDSQLDAQKKQLGQEIDALKQRMESAPDDQKAALQDQITQKEQEMRAVQGQRQDARQENRQQGRGQEQAASRGGGRANAPGQQGKTR